MPFTGTMKVASAALVLTSTLLAAVPQAEARPGFYSGRNYSSGYSGRHYYSGPAYRHHRGNAGAAAAAGVIGGLALGALAAGANRGSYYDSYPSNGYGGCYVTRQRVYDGWGNPRWRRVQVCD